MTAVQVEDIVFVGAVSLLAGWQLANFARRVGKHRMKHKIPYPAMSGDEAFMRVLRAQQNTLEFAPIFFVTLWMAAIFFHQVPAAVLGLAYVYSRFKYFDGYVKEVNARLLGFKMGVKCIMGLLAMAMVGILTCTLRRYTNIDLKRIAVQNVADVYPGIRQLV